MIQNERSYLLVPEVENPKDLEEKVPHVEKSGRLAVLLLSVGLAVTLAIHLATTRTSHTAGVAPQGQGWDKTFDLWEASLYHHGNSDLANVELLGRSHHHHHHHSDDDDDDDELIYFNHTKAFHMLKTDDKSNALDFYYYQQGWEAQINQAYCGVATSAAFMNSLRGLIELPQDPIYEPFPWATQNAVIRNECARETVYDVDKMKGQFWGIGLDMAEQLLNCNLASQGYQATAYHVDAKNTSVDELRDAIKEALFDRDARVGINYDRGGIGQGDMGHGHFSPIAAYNHEKDAFLVMDVAKYKYAPVWVPTSRLIGGISGVDLCANFDYPDAPLDMSSSMTMVEFAKLIGCKPAHRGYIIVSPTE